MRKMILGAASAIAFASPAFAADLAIPRYSEVPNYQPYEYRAAPPVVVEEPAPFVVAPPPVVVEQYPVYAAPPVYAAAPYAYAYAGPGWHRGWGHQHHFHGRW